MTPYGMAAVITLLALSMASSAPASCSAFPMRMPPSTSGSARPPPAPWRERIRLAGLGAASFLAIGLLAISLSDRRSGAEVVQLGLRDLALAFVCALVASAIPASARWASVLYGCLVPAIVAALAVAARDGG